MKQSKSDFNYSSTLKFAVALFGGQALLLSGTIALAIYASDVVITNQKNASAVEEVNCTPSKKHNKLIPMIATVGVAISAFV